MPFFGVITDLGLDNVDRQTRPSIEDRINYHEKQIQYHKNELKKLKATRRKTKSRY